jgi:hypothetical protein
MKTVLAAALPWVAYAMVAVALAACGGCSTANTQAILNNLQGCERHYNGTVAGGMTGGQFTGSVKIDCVPPQTGAPQPSATTPTPSSAS